MLMTPSQQTNSIIALCFQSMEISSQHKSDQVNKLETSASNWLLADLVNSSVNEIYISSDH